MRNYMALELQKMELELKCPICLKLLSKPLRVPCNHLFCSRCIKTSYNESECPVCTLHFLNGDLRAANHIETFVTIYKNMRTALGANDLQQGSQVEIPDTKTLSPQSGNTQAQKNSQELVQSMLIEKSGNLQSLKVLFGNMKTDGEANGVKEAFFDQEEPHTPSPFGEEYNSNDSGSETGTKINSHKNLSKRELGVESSHGTKGSISELKRQKVNIDADLGDTIGGTNANNLSTYNSGAEPEQEAQQNMQQQPFSCNPATNALVECAFCHSFRLTEVSGPMQHYVNEIQRVAEHASQPDVLHVHQKCIDWAPRVYFEGETAMNLSAEVSRAAKIKCCCCGLKGAALGCYVKSCRRSYHVPCAVMVPECRWDCVNFLVLCPAHTSHKLPCDKSSNKKNIEVKSSSEKSTVCSDTEGAPDPSRRQQVDEVWSASPGLSRGWVFCGSFLSPEEKDLMDEFASLMGAHVSKGWKESVTHVFASTDEHGAFTRTHNVLMGILSGKWILKIDWVKACMDAGYPVPEEPYEFTHDVCSCFNGPKTGRIWALTKAPKLFTGLSFYFHGYYMPCDRTCFENYVRTGGGTVYKKSQILGLEDASSKENVGKVFIVYNIDPPPGFSPNDCPNVIKKWSDDALAVAAKIGARFVSHTWLLDTIAAFSVPENL